MNALISSFFVYIYDRRCTFLTSSGAAFDISLKKSRRLFIVAAFNYNFRFSESEKAPYQFHALFDPTSCCNADARAHATAALEGNFHYRNKQAGYLARIS